MKKLIPSIWLVMASQSIMAAGDGSGIDAYRQGNYWQAAAELSKDATRDPVALYYLGRMKLYGYGELKNNTQALQYIETAAAKGHVPAMLILGRIALNLDKNPTQALSWFKKAAEAHDLFAELYCMGAYKFGFGTSKNIDLVERYAISSAKAGNILGQFTLAEVFLKNKNISTRRAGLAWLEKAADKGYPDALFKLGQLYASGDLVKKDLERADALYDAALKAGVIDAWRGKGDLALARGDYASAKECYTKAVSLGDNRAQVSLALLSFDKKFPGYNEEAGKAALLSAADAHIPGAALALSRLNGKAEDKAKSKEWLKREQALEQQVSSTPEKEMALWISRGQQTNLAASGYGLHGILTTWQNKSSLANQIYNQAPQMESTTKQSIYNPSFTLAMPNTIPLEELYVVYVQSMSQRQSDYDFPKYDRVMPEVNDHLIAKAILGDSTAQFALGQLYQQGVSVPKDMQEAIKYYGKSAAQFDLRAEYNLGLLYLEGQNGTPDYQQALGWLTDAAFKGSADAQYVLGQLLSKGYRDASGALVIEPDLEQATAMYYLGAANRHARSQFQLAELLSRASTQSLTVAQKTERFNLLKSLYQHASEAGVENARIPLAFFQAMSQDPNQQKTAFEVASAHESNNSLAAFLLGLLYDRGIGVDVSHNKAMKYYERAEQLPVTAFIRGTYAASDKDTEEARHLLTKAQEAKFSYASLNLAILDKQEQRDFLPKLIEARSLGNHRASLLLADYYLMSATGDTQLNEARDIFRQVAEKGDKEAQLKLGYLYENGLGGPVDIREAVDWYLKSAESGQPIAQYRLGRIYQLGRLDGKPNYSGAKFWYEKAKNQYVPAAIALGFVYDTVNDNYQRALDSYQIAIKQGDAIAQFNAGLIYEKGKGVPVNTEKARELYLLAAEHGHVQAMVELAGLYFSGAMGQRNEKEALHWYQKAAASKDREALYYLGLLSETGVALPLDYKAAQQYYQASASRGDEQAMLALARLYQHGQGVNKNSQEAEVLYKDLAHNGNAYAAYQLAVMSYEGLLSDSNPARTQEWLQLAVNNGSHEAQQMLLWLKAQTDQYASFIEPIQWNTSGVASDESADWRYLGAVDALNRGNELSSKRMLDDLLKDHPDYSPAVEAYHRIQSADMWDLSKERKS